MSASLQHARTACAVKLLSHRELVAIPLHAACIRRLANTDFLVNDWYIDIKISRAKTKGAKSDSDSLAYRDESLQEMAHTPHQHQKKKRKSLSLIKSGIGFKYFQDQKLATLIIL